MAVEFFAKYCLFLVCNSVRIGQNLLNETPVERSVLAYFANYHLSSSNRDLTKPRRRRQRERQKTIGLMSKTTTLHVHHAFLYISFLQCTTTTGNDQILSLLGNGNGKGDKFYHLCPNLSALPSLQLQPKFPSFKQQGELG